MLSSQRPLYYLFFFFFYGVIGWISEVAFAFIRTRKFVNRGFLIGPICPMYGVGAVLFLLIGNFTHNNLILTFLTSAIAASALEYVTGYLLEKIFKKRYWDYSNTPGNINGYIAPRWALVWGAAGVLEDFIIHPLALKLVSGIPVRFTELFLIVASIGLVIDITVTVMQHFRLSTKITELDSISKRLENQPNKKEQTNLKGQYNMVLNRSGNGESRILRAFSNMRSRTFEESVTAVKDRNKRISSAIQKAKREYNLEKSQIKTQIAQDKLSKKAKEGDKLNQSLNKKKARELKNKEILADAKKSYKEYVRKINNGYDE